MTATERFHLMTKDSALKANLSNRVRPFAGEKTMQCIFIFLRNYSINYFRSFLWCGPNTDKEKQRCRRTQSRDRGCHQKSIFSLRFPVRAAFCGLFFLIFALTFVKLWCGYCCSLSIYSVYFVVLWNFSGGKNIFREFSIRDREALQWFWLIFSPYLPSLYFPCFYSHFLLVCCGICRDGLRSVWPHIGPICYLYMPESQN